MEIRSLSAVPPPARAPRIATGGEAPPPTTRAPADAGPSAASPASVAVPSNARETRFVRDEETNRLVLSVVDAGSGDVIAQLPSKAALRAQAYADTQAARVAARPGVARIA